MFQDLIKGFNGEVCTFSSTALNHAIGGNVYTLLEDFLIFIKMSYIYIYWKAIHCFVKKSVSKDIYNNTEDFLFK